MVEIEDMRNGTYAIAEGGEQLAFSDSREQADRIKRALENAEMRVIGFSATPEQDKLIEDVLDLADTHFADVLNGDTRTHTLVAVLDDWRKRVAADQRRKPQRTDNGDGTVTFVVPVTVRADVLRGCDVLAVRAPRTGDMFVVSSGGRAILAMRNWNDGYRIIIGPKPHPPEPPQPAFREGGFYRDGYGDVHGPLRCGGTGVYRFSAKDGASYNVDGKCTDKDSSALDNLLPGEVIVWRHPGMVAGEYLWNGKGMTLRNAGYITADWAANVFASWTDPPRVGKWKVVDGQEYATWEGE